MTAHSTGLCAARTSLYAIFVLLLLVANVRAASNDVVRVQELQAQAVQIKQAVDQADTGSMPAAALVTRFEHALDGFRDAASPSSDLQFQHKYQAVALLFGKLKYQISHPAAAQAKPTKPTRAQVDIEVITDLHGATCETALGIAENLPVQVVLAQAGKVRSDAWFRFEPAMTGSFRFTTDSNGADPAIQILRSCSAGAQVVAANDDAFGLDASASAKVADRSPLMLHLTNSGEAGPVMLGVAGASPTIAGNVKDAATNLPIASAFVILVDAQAEGGFADFIYTDQNGNYLLTGYPSSFYVRAYANSYVGQLYPSADCQPGYNYNYSADGCDIADAQVITVADGDTVSGIDFALGTGQQILGHVLDNSNQPIAASVTLFDTAGDELLSSGTAADGSYIFTTLPAAGYKIEATSGSYVSQMYDHIACDGPLQTQCNLASASVVTISTADFAGADFNLQVLASIQGVVSDANSQTVPYAQINVQDASGNIVIQTGSDYYGNFSAGPLGIGTYYIYAAASGYFSQAYDGTDCATPTCASEILDATAIVITQLGQQATADFHLHPVPSVSGHVQDAVTGLPLANVTVWTSPNPPSSFNNAGYATTNQNGNYTLTGIQAGQYYVWAISDDHADQIYSGVPCESINSGFFYYPGANCNVSGATLLRIAPGQTPGAFNFSLIPSSRIAGNVLTNAGAGSGIAASATVNIYDGTGDIIRSAATDALGNYIVNDLPPGTYYAAVSQDYYNPAYFGQVWDNINCGNSCVPTTGTPITVAQATIAAGIDFSLVELDAVVGRVTDAQGSPIAGSLVDLFLTQDGSFQGSAVVDAQGYYRAQGDVGNSYFVATEGGPSFVDQVYSGISCLAGSAYYGLCPLTQATPVSLNTYSWQPHVVNFVLQRAETIFANGFE